MKKRITFLFIVFCALLLPWQGSAQTTGSTCNNPLLVYATPFNDAGNTGTYGNNYSSSDVPPEAPGAVTDGTGSTSYLNGNDVVYSYTAGSNGSITINTTHSGSSDWHSLWVFTGCPFASTVGYHTQTTGTTRSISNLPVTMGQTYYIVISNWNSGDMDYTIDITGTQVLNPPTCLPPSNLAVSNVGATSVDLVWTDNTGATLWDIEWGVEGFTPTGTPTISGVTSNPYTLSTGLSPQTKYDFYVRADCGGGDFSFWTGPFTFKTACTSQLSGTYSIGGAAADFATLTDAVASLNDCGVSGPVVFNVTPGSGPFNEQLIITEFMGSSSTNTVTFNGNGETLSAPTTSDSRSLFLLDGADYVTITDFNLVTISDSNNFVIQLTNDADFNVISNNTIDMSSTLGSTSTSNAGILVGGSLTSATATTGVSGSNNTISGNTIYGGYYGINVNGQSSTPSLNNTISDNTLEDFYSYGISLRYNNNSIVTNNDISRPTRVTVSTLYGIYLASGGEGNAIENNRVHTLFGGITATNSSANYGIYHSANDSPLGNESRVVNNIVHITGNNGTIYALYNSNSDGVHYYHNTVVLDDVNATAGTTRGFYQTGTADNIEIKNNIFSIMREGSGAKHCLYFGASASVIVSDHNVLHMASTSGTTGIGYSGSGQSTLADWQTATSGDMNSVDVNPLFVNRLGGDFTPSNAAVNNIGTPVGVASDFDGNLRNTTTPDPGAYEFTPPACPQPSALDVSNITATTADLSWTENGTASNWDIEWGPKGFVPTEIPTLSTTTNPHTLTGLTALREYDFYVRANCGGGDESTWVGPYTFRAGCAGPLAGSYSVGASGDFFTLTDVAYALNTCGISASVTFNLLPGSGPYEEQITLEEIVGASATNTITLNGNGETLTALTASGNRSLILLDGTDYTTIVNFNFVTQSETNNFVVQLTGNADYNTLTNNTFDMSSTMDNTGSTNVGIVVSGSLTSATSTTGNSGTNNIFVGNTIIGGYYGISVYGQSSTRSLDNIISDNIIQDFYSTGIRVGYNNNSVVSNNDISRPSRSTVTTFYGIYFISGGEGHIVTNNKIHNPFGGTTSRSSTASYGIYHSSNDSPIGNESQVINNIVNLTGSDGTIYALYNSNSDGVYYYHNTVSLDDMNATSGTTRGFYQTAAATNIDVKNNIFSITRTGSGVKYCLYFNTASSVITSDHNVLHMGATDGTTAIGYSGSAHTTLADWQTATLGDSNSVDADPLFINPLSLDFLPSNPAVDNIGTPVGVSSDINGNARSATTPDAGAYEFTPPSCISPSFIQVSNVTTSSADIVWQENGTATEWEVEYGQSGFTQGSGTVVVDNDGTLGISLSSLAANTLYDVYVRAICSSTDESAWYGPYTFKTECAPFSAPYVMDFETSMDLTPDCWSDSGWEFETSPTNGNNYSGNGGSGYFAFVDASSPYKPDATLTSPLIDISGLTSPKLEFYKYHYDANTSSTSVSNKLTVEIYDGAAWNIVHLDDNGDVNAWEKVEIDLTTLTITGDIQVRFIVDTTVGSNYFNDIGIDDVSFTGITPCVGVDPPVGAEYQAFLGSETLADLDVTGTNLTWYADASGINQLPDTTALVDGTTYYVSQSASGCESDLLAVTALKGFVYLDNTWLPFNPSGASTATDNIYVVDGLTTINVPLDAQDIHVMNGGTLRIENVLHLHGDLTVDGELIFGSTPSGNGELAAVSATSTITGEVTVEHYMKDRRSYRMVSSAVTTTTSIHDNWQEGATSRSDNPNPGYGTHITGTTVDQTNGFDGTQTGNASMFTIDVPNQVFQAIANTDVNTLTAGDAYLMFIRGDRTLSNIDTPDGHTATTLRARGQLVTGNQMQAYPTTTAGQFVMFGNPYQSAIDINDVFANSTNVNTNQYYVYDVNIGDYGNYVTVNLPAGTNPSGSVANQYLQAGQAAQVATLSNGPTVLNFMESDKAPGNYTSNNAGANGLMSSDILNIQLYTAKNFNEGGSVHDGMAILFDAQYSSNITATDAPKAFGFGENIARDHNGTYLSIERREMPVAGEVYSLYTAGYNHQEYVFKIDLEGVTDVMMYLDDNYTGTSTLLQAGVNTYSFEVSDELSQANDRFSIRTESLLNIDDPTSFAGVRLYPNPLNAETFYVHAPMLNGKKVEIRIADISGRQIYNRTLQSTSDRIEVSVNDTLSSGVYLVTIRHAGEFKTYRLIRE